MRQTNIRNFDVNTLVALEVLLREKHISRAASILGMSQPAMSRALARLRMLLDDELLVSSGRGLDLTPRAKALIDPLHDVLSSIEQLVHVPEFNPANVSAEIRLAMLDMEMLLYVPRLVARVRKEAPGLKIRILQMIGGDFSVLDNNIADYVMTALDSSGARYHRRRLFSDHHVTVCRPSLARRMNNKLDINNFVELDHGLVSPEGRGEGLVDRALKQLGLERKVVLHIPHFLLVPHVCKTSDILFTIPSKIASQVNNTPKVAIMKPPLETTNANFYLYWHARHHHDPLHVWLRELLFNLST